MNWHDYDERLIRRGELILDLDFLRNYRAEVDIMNRGKTGKALYEVWQELKQKYAGLGGSGWRVRMVGQSNIWNQKIRHDASILSRGFAFKGLNEVPIRKEHKQILRVAKFRR